MMSYPPAPSLGTRRFELHSGPSDVTKGVLGGCLVMCVVFLVPLLGFISAILAGGFASSVTVGVIVGIPVMLGFGAGLVVRMLWLFRSAAWLEGTTLVVRGTFTTRRCDLATTVRFALDWAPQEHVAPGAAGGRIRWTQPRVPRLTVYDAVTGRCVRLRLFDLATRRPLDGPKLYALAAAIMAGRGQGPEAWEAWRVANGLYAIAADPLSAVR